MLGIRVPNVVCDPQELGEAGGLDVRVGGKDGVQVWGVDVEYL